MKRTLIAAGALAGVVLTLTSGTPAHAEERICRGAIGKTTVDNLRVPQGATCTLRGTYVKGTVKVGRGATVRVFSARIVGNVQSEGHRWVRVERSRVGGSVQLKQGGGVLVRNNKVKGDVQLFSNRKGSKTVSYNRIDGNLQCKSNRPAPTGRGNVVGGNKEDQCRRL